MNASFKIVANMFGFQKTVDCENADSGGVGADGTATAGKAGTVTGAAEVTVANHGLQDGDVVDVMWDAGRRYGCTVDATGDALALSSGGGDALPAVQTAVVVAKRQEVTISFDPSKMSSILAFAKGRISVTLVDADGVVLKNVYLKSAGKALTWIEDCGIDKPIADTLVAKAYVAAGSVEATDFNIAVQYQALA